MTYIPNIRSTVKETLYTTKESCDAKENAYFQGYLNDNDANYIAGYDWVIDHILETFLYNIDMYEDELDECGFDDVRIDKFSNIFDEFVKLENTENPMNLTDIKDSKIALILTLYRAFKDYAEMERDTLGVALIENMEDAEYDECVEKYKAGYKNAIITQEESGLLD